MHVELYANLVTAPAASPSLAQRFADCVASGTCGVPGDAQVYLPTAGSAAGAGASWSSAVSKLELLRLPSGGSERLDAPSAVGFTDARGSAQAPDLATNLDLATLDFKESMEMITRVQRELMNFSLASQVVSVTQTGTKTLFQTQG